MIIFIGVSGSGKSVQAKMLASEMGYAWISSGQFLRMLLDGQSRQDMVDGKLLPDKEVIKLLDEVIDVAKTNSQCVLDGFPRTNAQVDWLISQSRTGRFKIDMVFHLSVDHSIAKERLLKRSRLDDHEAAIDQRLSEYTDVTVPIVDKFRSAGVVVNDIDAGQSIEAVHGQIVELVKKG